MSGVIGQSNGASAQPCKRHQWSVTREFRTAKKTPAGNLTNQVGVWQQLSCRKCEGIGGRWKR